MNLTDEQKQKNKENYQKRKKKQEKRSRIISILVIFIVVFIIPFIGFMWGVIGVNLDYSNGERTISVIKLTEKGYFWKTYEGSGVLVNAKGYGTSAVWNFSIDSNDPNKEKIWNELQESFKYGIPIKVIYNQRGGSVPWRGSTSYFIKEISYPEGFDIEKYKAEIEMQKTR